jgi:hypothetical protein
MLELLLKNTKLLQGYSFVNTHWLKIQGRTRLEQLKLTIFKSVLGHTLSWPWLLVTESLKSLSFILVLNSILSLPVFCDGQLP